MNHSSLHSGTSHDFWDIHECQNKNLQQNQRNWATQGPIRSSQDVEGEGMEERMAPFPKRIERWDVEHMHHTHTATARAHQSVQLTLQMLMLT